MINSPETPFIATGLLITAAAIKKQGTVNATAFQGIVATILLTLIASATAGTKAAGIVRAVGILLLIAAASVAVRSFQTKTRNPK
jgi:hypothetical protein